MAMFVRFRVLAGVAVVALDAPPVNALSAEMRGEVWDAYTRIETSHDIKAVVVMATGRMFSAGADINELDHPAKEPSLAQLCDKIESCTKPVIVAVHGQTLGGGAELLMAAHFRLAAPDAQIGLPDVDMGLIPSAGGTQRLPRLVGPQRALQLMVSTTAVNANAAHQIGLVDGVVQGDLGSGAIAFAKNLIAHGQGPRPTRADRTQIKDGRVVQAAVANARATLARNPLHAVHRVVDCIEASTVLPFEAALAFENDAFERCLAHPQSLALRYVFRAERKIDNALIARSEGAFVPVDPMGKAVVSRLNQAMKAAADVLVTKGVNAAQIDAAMVAFGFLKGPFGGSENAVHNGQIVRRVIAALLVEGAACVAQQAVQRASDVDVLAVHGIGFPRRSGGPMHAANAMGLIGLRNDLRAWSEDSDIWGVPDALNEAIKHSDGFDALGAR